VSSRVSSADRHAVDEIKKVVVVAKATGVVELFAGALASVVVVPDVRVVAGPRLVGH